MKFRDEDNLMARVIIDSDFLSFENRINNLDAHYDLVDLQYSTTTRLNGDTEFSALALVRRKK